MSRILIVGTGDHARVIAELLRAAGHEVGGHVEPNPGRAAGDPRVAPVFDGLADDAGWLAAERGAAVVVAVGANDVRRRLYERCRALGLRPAAAVHPSAVVLGGAAIGDGAQVCAQALIGVDAVVGENVIVNSAASVDHDVVLEPHAFVGPGARLAGRVRVGEGAHVGIGAVVREGAIIGRGALVAAGAVVVADVPDGARVAGVPARSMDSQPVNEQA